MGCARAAAQPSKDHSHRTGTSKRLGRSYTNSVGRQGAGAISRIAPLHDAKCEPAPESRAADVLAPAPGQGEGWGGGRNQASAMPAFDPHPTLPPARGKEQLSLVTYLTTFRASRVSLHHARGQGLGMPSQPGPATLAICDQPLDPQCNLPKILRRVNHFSGVAQKA